MPKPTEHDLDRFVQQNVLCCLSPLVSTLANGLGFDSHPRAPLEDLCAQAQELAAPVDDYEEAARQEYWIVSDSGTQFVREDEIDPETGLCAAFGRFEGGNPSADDWQALCEEYGIEPYAWEVYEHWAVDSRFAEHLIAQGEKVDTDFAGLNVWGRTTTGQAISMDGVITRIWNEIHKPL